MVGNGDGLPLGRGFGVVKQCSGRGGAALGNRQRERMATQRRGGARARGDAAERKNMVTGEDGCVGKMRAVARRCNAGGTGAWATRRRGHDDQKRARRQWLGQQQRCGVRRKDDRGNGIYGVPPMIDKEQKEKNFSACTLVTGRTGKDDRT